MDELAAAAAVPVVPTEVDLQEDTTLGDDGISQDAYSSMDVTDGVLPRHLGG